MGYVYVAAKKKTKAEQSGHWDDKVKQRVVILFLAGKTSAQISSDTGVPKDTIANWRLLPWFKAMVKEIQSNDGHKLDAKLTKLLHESLDVIKDRLDSGEYIRDEKTGKIVRVPVKMRDANVAFNTLMDKRQVIRNLPTKIADTSTVQQQLTNLANEFRKFVGKAPLRDKQGTLIEGEHVLIEDIDPVTGIGTGVYIEKVLDDIDET